MWNVQVGRDEGSVGSAAAHRMARRIPWRVKRPVAYDHRGQAAQPVLLRRPLGAHKPHVQ
jgi:hypothetical protein